MVARQTARLPLGGGLDLKSDEKYVDVPKVEVLTNVELRANGVLNKRRSLKQVSDGGAGDVATLVGGNKRLLVNADSTAGSVVRANGSTHDSPTTLCPVTTSQRIVSRKTVAHGLGQCAAFEGKLAVTAERQSAAELFAMEVDADTGLIDTPQYPADTPTLGSGSGTTKVRAVADHGFLVIWAENDGAGNSDIFAQLYIDGAFQGSKTQLVNAIPEGPPSNALPGIFDAVVDATGDVLYLAYQFNSTMVVASWDITGTGSSITITATGNSQTYISQDPDAGLAITLDTSNSEVIVLQAGQFNDVFVHTAPYALGSLATHTIVAGIDNPAFPNVGIAYLGGDYVAILYTDEDTGSGIDKVIHYRVDTQTGTADNSHEMRGVYLAHEPVVFAPHGTDMTFFGLLRALDDLEPFYVTMAVNSSDASGSPVPIAQYQYTTAVTADSAEFNPFNISSVAQITTDTGTRFYWSSPIRTEIQNIAGSVESNQSVGLHSFEFSAETQWNHDHGHGAMMVAAGIPMAVVGNLAWMAGHMSGPVILSSGISNGGNLVDGEYAFQATYVLMDQDGRIWRSRPSTVGSETTLSPDSTVDVTVSTPVVPASVAQSDITVQVELWMTVTGATGVKFRVGSLVGSNVDFLTALSVTFSVTVVPSGTDEVLYTDAQELGHFPPPPCTSIVKYKNRFAAIHAETGDIWFSFPFTEGQGIHWNPVHIVKNDDPSDKPTALFSTDSSLGVLYKNRMGYIYGDGPNKQGLGQPFTDVQFLPDSDVGAISQKTVQKLPAGVFFCDPDKGFHIIPYGGAAPQYVGRDLDGVPDETIVGTAHLPDRHEVRVVFYNAQSFANDTASWYTYHYDLQQWSAGDAADHDTAVLYGVSDGNEFLIDGVGEDLVPGYDGASTYVTMKIRTGWLVMSQIADKQGFFKLWNVYVLCESQDEANLRIRLYYDYDGSSADNVDSLAYADDRLKIWPGTQGVEAFKLEIYDEASGGTSTGEGVRLSDIELEFGLFPGIRPRVPTTGIASGS